VGSRYWIDWSFFVQHQVRHIHYLNTHARTPARSVCAHTVAQCACTHTRALFSSHIVCVSACILLYSDHENLLSPPPHSDESATTTTTEEFERRGSFGRCTTSANAELDDPPTAKGSSSEGEVHVGDGGGGGGSWKPKVARSGGEGTVRKQWTVEEEGRFLKALARFAPNDTDADDGNRLGPGVAQLISLVVGTRSVVQVCRVVLQRVAVRCSV